jgi:hypothetical protein
VKWNGAEKFRTGSFDTRVARPRNAYTALPVAGEADRHFSVNAELVYSLMPFVRPAPEAMG